MKYYPKKSRVTTVKVSLTADQIAVLINHCLYRGGPRSLSVQEEAQFVLDWACSECAIAADTRDLLREVGSDSLAFNPEKLPDPQQEASERRREKRRKRLRSC